MRTTILGLTAAAWLLAAPASRAEFVLTLSSDAADLENLAVGQSVRFDVILAGFGEPGNPAALTNLNVDVAFASAHFGTPTSLTPGPIVPSPGETFVPTVQPGLAGAIFLNTFSPPPGLTLTEDGIFYSFVVTALAPGSGTIAFDPAATAFNGTDQVPIDSSFTVAYRIRAVGAVPEPSALVSAGLGAVGLLGARALRRRGGSIGPRRPR